MPVKWREGMLFKWFQVKLGWSQNSFITPVGFKLTPDKIHGTRGEFTLKVTSEKNIKTEPVFNKKGIFISNGIEKGRAKDAFHKL